MAQKLSEQRLLLRKEGVSSDLHALGQTRHDTVRKMPKSQGGGDPRNNQHNPNTPTTGRR